MHKKRCKDLRLHSVGKIQFLKQKLRNFRAPIFIADEKDPFPPTNIYFAVCCTDLKRLE